MMNLLNTTSINFNNWLFLLIFLNIVIYVLSIAVFFSIFFLTDVAVFKTTANFKLLTQTSFSTNLIVFLFLALAGLPPFLSFIGKFFLFMMIFYSSNWIVISLFFLFNSFVIYFYIQHLRLLCTKRKVFSTLFKQHISFLNFSLIHTIIFSVFFLVFGVFFISDLFIYLSPLILF